MEMNTYPLLISQASYNQYYTVYPELHKQPGKPSRSLLPCLPPRSLLGRQRNAPEEDVVALFADVGPETQELAIYPMQDGLEVLTFPGVLTVK